MGVSYAYPSPLVDWYFHCPEDPYESEYDLAPGILPDMLREFVDLGSSHLVAAGKPTKDYQYILMAPSLEYGIRVRKWIKVNSSCVLEGVIENNSAVESRVQLVVTNRGKTIYLAE